MNNPINIALFGAGGKMGCRLADHLCDNPAYAVSYVENGEHGLANLKSRSLTATPSHEAVARADVVILAIPDRALGPLAHAIAPKLKPGAMVMTLDPAAAHAGELPKRADITYFVSHPCHPSVFDHFKTEAEIADFFGGTHARQAIVCALMQGPEAHYALGERIAKDIYAPVTRSHRVTVEQMAILEPSMAETVAIGLILIMREGMEETIRRGVPRAAAEDFMFGHIKVGLGIAFGQAGFPLSDGAKLIASYGQEAMLRPDWRRLFEPENVKTQVRAIVSGQRPA